MRTGRLLLVLGAAAWGGGACTGEEEEVVRNPFDAAVDGSVFNSDGNPFPIDAGEEDDAAR